MNEKYFEKIDGSSTHASRRIIGRCVLVGIGMTPMYEIKNAGVTPNTKGTIQIKNLNAPKTGGTTLVEFPVVSVSAYAVSSFMSLSDDDGGVLFEDGIYVSDTTDLSGTGQASPLMNFSLMLYYQGGGGDLDA